MNIPSIILRPIAFAFVMAAAGAATAQADYPSKPVRIIAPFPAGSGPDANAREIAAELTKILGQSFFVENRPGASNIIRMARFLSKGVTRWQSRHHGGLIMTMKLNGFTPAPIARPVPTRR